MIELSIIQILNLQNHEIEPKSVRNSVNTSSPPTGVDEIGDIFLYFREIPLAACQLPRPFDINLLVAWSCVYTLSGDGPRSEVSGLIKQ